MEVKYEILKVKICDGSITTAKIGSFDPDELGPLARAQWESLKQKIKLMDEFDYTHPNLYRFRNWQIIGSWYNRIRRFYVQKKYKNL